jgi:EpsI family protein
VFPERVGEWTNAGDRFFWEPQYVGASFSGAGVYEAGDSRVGLHVALYPDQRQGAELVSSANSLVPPEDDGWRQLSLARRGVSLAGGLDVEEGILTGPNGELLVWKWFWISGHRTSSPIWAKAIETSEKLLLRQPYAAGIIAFTERDDEESARIRLEEFLAEGLPALESGLEKLSR